MNHAQEKLAPVKKYLAEERFQKALIFTEKLNN
jgi:ribosomal protein L29